MSGALSSHPMAIRVPSKENVTELRICSGSVRVNVLRPSMASHSTTVCLLAIASHLRSADKVTPEFSCARPLKYRTSCPGSESHTLTVSSTPPVASHVPSGEKATEVTVAEWPLKTCLSLPVDTSQRRAV